MVKIRKRDGRIVELKRDGRIVEYVEPKIEADTQRGDAAGNEAAPAAKEIAAPRNVNDTSALVELCDAKPNTTTNPLKAAMIAWTPTLAEILRTVSPPEGFHFYTAVGQPTGVVATSLPDFMEKILEVDSRSVRFHFTHRDFEKWLRDVIRDTELATSLTTIPYHTDGEALRSEICRIVEARLSDLQRAPSSRAARSPHTPFEKAIGGCEAR